MKIEMNQQDFEAALGKHLSKSTREINKIKAKENLAIFMTAAAGGIGASVLAATAIKAAADAPDDQKSTAATIAMGSIIVGSVAIGSAASTVTDYIHYKSCQHVTAAISESWIDSFGVPDEWKAEYKDQKADPEN